VITAHCSDLEDHEECTAPLACNCACHLSDGKREEARAGLADVAPIRGPVFPPKPPATVPARLPVPKFDELPPPAIAPPSRRRPLEVDDPGPFPPGVFSLGLTHPANHQEATVPRSSSSTCTICNKPFKNANGLRIHEGRTGHISDPDVGGARPEPAERAKRARKASKSRKGSKRARSRAPESDPEPAFPVEIPGSTVLLERTWTPAPNTTITVKLCADLFTLEPAVRDHLLELVDELRTGLDTYA
jgi:hypothetical protein